MGNIQNKHSKEFEDKLLPVHNININIGDSNDQQYSTKISYLLVGDRPSGRFKKDTEKIPPDVDEDEFNDVLADAYLCGII